VTVKLIGRDGNVFAIIGAVQKAIRREHGAEAADQFATEAMSQASYDDVLLLVQRTVEAT
jgi:hypothetical protein